MSIFSLFNGARSGRWQRGTTVDADAATYIAAVETADTQALELDVITAINTFVVGCKSDGIWHAIKASCILAGARTLTGALVPLVGPAPTNFNFVSGDYNRVTGLKGNGSTKYLRSNRANNDDPQNNAHIACFVTNAPANTTAILMGTGNETGRHTFLSLTSQTGYRSRTNTSISALADADLVGFVGGARLAANLAVYRRGGSSVTSGLSSEVPSASTIGVFASGAGATPINARLAFYSVGEGLDLDLLDARVTALITAYGAAIP